MKKRVIISILVAFILLKIRSIVTSAEITPKSSEGDVKSLFSTFFMMMMMMKKDPRGGEDLGEDEIKEVEKEIWEAKEKITGEVIAISGV